MKKIDERTEVGVKILEALDDADFATIEKIVASGLCSLDEIREGYNWNWLHICLSIEQLEGVPRESIEYLIQHGNDVNLKDIDDMTPLHFAMRAKNVEAAKALLEAGADPNIPNNRKIIPLAYINGQPQELELLKLMLDKGGDVHFHNGYRTIIEGIKERSLSKEEFIPVLKIMEQYA